MRLCADDVRASLVCAALRQATPEAWGGAHSFAVCRGASTANSDELRYLKSVALHQWLFGVELPGARTQRSRGAAGGGAPKNPRARQQQRALHAHSRAALPLRPRAAWRARADTVLLFTPDALHALLSPKKGARARGTLFRAVGPARVLTLSRRPCPVCAVQRRCCAPSWRC